MNIPGHSALAPASAEALLRFQIVSQVLSRMAGGFTRSRAATQVAGDVHVTLSGAHRRVSLRSVYRWLAAYQAGGLPALEPRLYPHISDSRVLVAELANFVAAEKIRDRRASVPELIHRAREQGVVSPSTPVSRTTVYRFLLRQNIPVARIQKASERDSRRFAYPHRLQMVLADGKHFRAGVKRLKRVALFFLDDATRLGLSVVVAPSEDTEVFLRSFHALVCQYGFPDTVFVDNGPGFISEATLGVFGRLGIPLIHGKAGYPEGHGKIERFNQTAKAAVLRQLQGRPDIDPAPESLTLRLGHYLREVYNHSPHEAHQGGTPWARFRDDEKPLRFPAERALFDEKFCVHLQRRVSPDHIVDVGGLDYEVPRGNAGRNVTLSQRLLDGRVLFVDRGRVTELAPVDLARNARDRRGPSTTSTPEPEAPPVPGAAEMAFNRSFAPVVDADGGFPEPVTCKGRSSR